MKDKLWMWLAWKLPRRLVYWAFLRATAEAGRKYPDQHLPAMSFDQIAKTLECTPT